MMLKRESFELKIMLSLAIKCLDYLQEWLSMKKWNRMDLFEINLLMTSISSVLSNLPLREWFLTLKLCNTISNEILRNNEDQDQWLKQSLSTFVHQKKMCSFNTTWMLQIDLKKS